MSNRGRHAESETSRGVPRYRGASFLANGTSFLLLIVLILPACLPARTVFIIHAVAGTAAAAAFALLPPYQERERRKPSNDDVSQLLSYLPTSVTPLLRYFVSFFESLRASARRWMDPNLQYGIDIRRSIFLPLANTVTSLPSRFFCNLYFLVLQFSAQRATPPE